MNSKFSIFNSDFMAGTIISVKMKSNPAFQSTIIWFIIKKKKDRELKSSAW